MSIENPDNITPLILAYVGDSALEVLVRQKLAMEGITKPGEINKLALNYVTAKNQCAACDRIMEHLTEKENDIYRRGKNAKSHSNPRNVSVYEYRKATGLEALFGALYLAGKTERLNELFNLVMEEHDGL